MSIASMVLAVMVVITGGNCSNMVSLAFPATISSAFSVDLSIVIDGDGLKGGSCFGRRKRETHSEVRILTAATIHKARSGSASDGCVDAMDSEGMFLPMCSSFSSLYHLL